jgi:membrane-associated phospholipid phosphatase
MLKIIAATATIILIIINICGSHAKQEKHVSDCLVIGRITLFILLTTAIVHLILRFPAFWWLNLLWIIYVIFLDILLETSFRLKRETFGSPHRANMLTGALVLALIIILAWL